MQQPRGMAVRTPLGVRFNPAPGPPPGRVSGCRLQLHACKEGVHAWASSPCMRGGGFDLAGAVASLAEGMCVYAECRAVGGVAAVVVGWCRVPTSMAGRC
jgi:hypothetical protein